MSLSQIVQTYADYTFLGFPAFDNIFTSGLVQVESNPAIMKTGTTIVRPHVNSLYSYTEMQRIASAATTITTSGITSGSTVAPIKHVGDSIGVTEYEQLTEGIDAQSFIADAIRPRIATDVHISIKNMLDGIYGVGGALASTHRVVYTDNGGIIDQTAISQAQVLLGEFGLKTTVLIMNSKTRHDIRASVIQTESTQYVGSVLQKGVVDTYLNMRIVIDDNLCSSETIDGNVYYPVYLGYGKPLYVGYRREMEVDYFKNTKIGGGRYDVDFYASYGISLQGVSFSAGGYNPTNTTLATVGSWTKVYENRDIPFVKLLVRSSF